MAPGSTPGGQDAAGTWIEARGLTKTFGGTVAIAGASLGLRRGEIRGVVGPNGAGKSTLIQLFAGALIPDAGELVIDGAPVKFRTPADALDLGISLVPQETRLAPNLTVTENITLGREPRRLGVVLGSAGRRRAREVLDRLKIAIDPDAAVSGLTTVQRRLVMTARAVISNARLIILDEPTAALAPEEADLILTVVRDLAADGVAFLYVSHRFGDIEAVADTVTGVRDGRVIADLHRGEITRRALVELVTPEDQARTPDTSPARAPRAGGPGSRAGRLAVTGLRGPGLDGFSVIVEPGEIVGLAGLAGSGADEAIETIAGIRKAAAGTVALGDLTVHGGDRVAAVKAGIAYISGDRSRSSFASHSVRANITMAALSQASTAFVPSAAKERRDAQALGGRVRLSAAKLSQPMSNAVRRQPAEGRVRALAGHRGPGAAPARPDGRRRRPRALGHSRPGARAGRARGRGDRGLDRSRRAGRACRADRDRQRRLCGAGAGGRADLRALDHRRAEPPGTGGGPVSDSDLKEALRCHMS